MVESKCFHRWSVAGACVSPGCRAVRLGGQEAGLRHPLVLSDETAQRIRELLAEGCSARAIARELHVARQTVARIRDA